LALSNYITASCSISEHTVYKNGKSAFMNKNTDLAGFLLSVYQWLDLKYARFYKMDNLSKLGWLASEILLKDSFSAKNYRPEETGLLLANASSSLDTDLKYAETIKDIPSPSVFVYTLPNIMIGEICIRNHFKGEASFFVSEHFDAGFVEQYVNNLLNSSILQACICGWVELLENEYTAVLFLVERSKDERPSLFKQNMHKIFQSEN
jgi:hypothetical protein